MRKWKNVTAGADLLRLLDANLNRAREAARVVEDIARFCLDDGTAYRRLREIRLGLGRFADSAGLDGALVLAARDTGRDVGREAPHRKTPGSADDVESVAALNFARLQEALRSLEEISRVIAPKASARLQSYRFAAYALHKGVSTALRRRGMLDGTRLYALLTGRLAPKGLERTARLLLRGGVDIIQLREKSLADRELLGAAAKVAALCRRAGALCIVNDRPDIALAADADGVHLGGEDLPVRDARRVLGEAKVIGVSTRSLAGARRAERDGADYVAIGPVYKSRVAAGKRPISPAVLRAVARSIRIPVFAIGGIDSGNLPAVLKSGINRVAACTALIAAKEPDAAARKFKRILKSTRRRHTGE